METAKIPSKKLIERECVECGVEDVIVNSRLVDVFEINILRTTKAFRQAAKAKGRKGIKKILSYGLACNFLKFNTDPVFNSLQKSVLWPRSVTLRRHCDMTVYILIRIHFIPRMRIITQTQMSPSKGAIVWHDDYTI